MACACMYVQVVIRAEDHTFASVNDVVICSSSPVTSSKLGSLEKAGRIAGKKKKKSSNLLRTSALDPS